MSDNCLIIHTPKLYYDGNDVCSKINYTAMGLFSLVSELNKNGFNAHIIHLGIEKYLNPKFKLSDYIKENNIKFLAFSLNWKEQSYDVIETAKIIKEQCPDVFISLGGQSAGFFAQEILENFSFIDAVIRGEGEKPIVELANKFINNVSSDNSANLCFRKGNKIIINKDCFTASNKDLDSYNFFNPDIMLHYSEYSKVPYILNYYKKDQLNNTESVHGICLGRGCLGNCVWCSGAYKVNKEISGRKSISYRSANRVISDIKLLKEKYNVKDFYFSFDPNPKDRSVIINLFNQIAVEFKEKINAFYNLDGLADKTFLEAFKNAFSPASGITFSPIFRNENLRKKYKSFFYTNKDLEDILEYMEKLQIYSELAFSNMPGVEDTENKNSEKYGEYLKHKFKFVKNTYFYPVEIEPGALWTYYPKKFNLTNPQKTFTDLYNENKSVEKSFESDFNSSCSA